MKKKILMAVGLTVLFTIISTNGQTQTPVTTSTKGITNCLPQWESSYSVINSNIYSATNKNIGIGTNNPQTTLHIVSLSETLIPTTIRIQTNGSPTKGNTITDLINSPLGFIINHQNKGVLILNSTTATINDQLVVNGITNLNGNVGIGIASPTEKLHIEGGSVLISNNTTTTPDLTIKRTLIGSKPSISLVSTWHDNETNTNYNGKFDIQMDGQTAKFMVTQGWTPQMVEIMSLTNGYSSINGDLNVVDKLIVHGISSLSGNVSVGTSVGTSLTVNSYSILKGDVVIGTSSVPADLTVNGNTAYTGNLSLGTTTATEKLNVKGNILLESQTSHNGGAFKFENITVQSGNGNYYDVLKISYNNYAASYITINASNLSLYKKSLQLNESEIIINDANNNRTAYIHQDGRIWAKKLLLADAEQWPDYVFEDNYKLQSLPELESYLKANKHLPDMPTANEIKDNGIDVGAVNTQLVKKVEELSLYLIEQNKQIEAQQKQIEELMKKVNK